MNQIQILDNTQTMSSREIADLTNKRHDNVMQVCRSLKSEGVCPEIQETPYTNEQNGQQYMQYVLTKRDSLVLVARLSPEFTARIVDRWQELEAKNAQVFHIPTTLSGALRLAAQQAEQIESQQLLIEQQKPAVDFLERYVEARSTKSLREVAKVLGIKERQFIQSLEQDEILYRLGGSLVPFAHYQHAGYFEVKTGEANGHAYHQTRFTPDGIAWIAKRVAGKKVA
jgi:phage antirepressor YoqD-like protein